MIYCVKQMTTEEVYFFLHIAQSVSLLVLPSVHPSVRLSVCLSVVCVMLSARLHLK